jgi:CRP-like cAMP-binding protein
MSFIDGEPRSHMALADQQALLLCVAHADLQPFLDQHPGCWRDIARLAVSKLRRAYQLIPLDAQLPAKARLIKRLRLVAHGYGFKEDAPRTRLRLSQEQLASTLGMTRQTVNKVLRELEHQGLVKLHYGEVELLNLPEWGGIGPPPRDRKHPRAASRHPLQGAQPAARRSRFSGCCWTFRAGK